MIRALAIVLELRYLYTHKYKTMKSETVTKALEIDPEFEKARNNKRDTEKILRITRKIQKGY